MPKNLRANTIANRNLVVKPQVNQYYGDGVNQEVNAIGDCYYTCGEVITTGDPFYVESCKIYKADDRPCIGIALESGILDDIISCVTKGSYYFAGKMDNDLWNLDGVVTNQAPSRFNVIWQKLGTMTSDYNCHLNIQEGIYI